jgi:hypothetical protein
MDADDLYIRKQVVSLKIARRLQQIGVPQRSLFIWECVNSDWRPAMQSIRTCNIEERTENRFSAFMASELGALLPSDIAVFKQRTGGHWQCIAAGPDIIGPNETASVYANTMPDALAKMLIQIVENRVVRLPWMAGAHGELYERQSSPIDKDRSSFMLEVQSD